MISLKQGVLLLLALLPLPSQLYAAQPSFDIDVKDLDRGTPAPSKASRPSPAAAPAPFGIDVKELDRKAPVEAPKAEKKKAKKSQAPVAASRTVKHKEAGSEPGYTRYTVKPGDHIFKILVGRFGMSNETAERLIPEIIRVNDIPNIKALTVGRTLLIPSGGKQEHVTKSAQRGKARHKMEEGSDTAARHAATAQHAAPGAATSPAPAPVAHFQAAPPRAPEITPLAPPATAATATAAPSQAATNPKTPTPTAAKTEIPPPPVPASSATMAAAKAPVVTGRILKAPVAPESKAAPSVAAAPRPQAPALAAPSAPVAAAPSSEISAKATAPAAPPVPPVNTWLCSVTEKDPAKIVDAVMNALSLRWSRNRIIQSDEGASNAYSIRVDRYFELGGMRYIVSIGENDPYNYTLLRLLEGAGYRVLMISSGDDFQAIGGKLLRRVGVAPDFGKHLIQGDQQNNGFLVQPDDAAGRRVVITSEIVNPKLKWIMPQGCSVR
jgi:hypothetical protein